MFSVINSFEESGYIKKVFMQYYFKHNWATLKDKEIDAIREVYDKDKQKQIMNNVLFTSGELTFSDTFIMESDIKSITSGFTSSGTYITNSLNGAYCEVGTYSKYGTSAPCYKYVSGNYTSTERKAMNNYIKTHHPTWVRKYTASKKYNCHSYTWIQNDSSNKYWLNDPMNYIVNGTVGVIGANGNASVGQRIIIFNNVGSALHSLIVTGYGTNSSSITTESKFGSYGVYTTKLSEMISAYSGKRYVVYN